jgi:spermidine synthase
LRARNLWERTVYGAGHQLRGTPGARVLVIGLGGAPDVMCAHHYGAATVTGVDINASAIAALRGPLSQFAGNPYNRANVTTHCMDGRTFVRSSRAQFDLLVMSGADTKSVHAAGSLAISENGLYTVEAFVDYFNRLADDGVLAIARFTEHDRKKLSATGIAALRRLGVATPERHFMVLLQDKWTSVLIAKQPLTQAQIARMRAWAASVPEQTGIFLPHYDPIGFALGLRPQILYPQLAGEPESDVAPLFAAAATNSEAAYLEAQALNLDPPTDDRPFYFDLTKRKDVLRTPGTAYAVLGKLLLVLSALAALCIALPVPFVRRSAPQAGLLRALLYFGGLGFGFMLFEIGLIQKLCQFLGHQSYAITVVLATLLVGAGLGSAAAGAMGVGRAVVRYVAIPLVLAFGWGILLGLEHYGPQWAGYDLTQRIGITALALLPLGFVLGMPFPTALAQAPSSLLPWAIAANGFTSVLGASAALPLAMLVGYRWLFVLACACYVVAALAVPKAAVQEEAAA